MEKQGEIVFAPYDRVLKHLLPIVPHKLKPNHLTMVRLVLAPLLIIPLHYDDYIVALVAFVLLAITDMLDGSLARLRNQITDWGKIWDPVADKLLVGVVVVMMLLKVNLSLTILVLSLEAAFILGGVLQKMHEENVDIKANVWGKIKMNLQCFGAGLLMLGFILVEPTLFTLGEVAFYFSLFFAVLSIFKHGI
ncbi:hypothetical protein A2482_00990 [Candidatus Falkowbacteria bacterium RIFOXYC2_FULL_48_21]|uniref:CDP-diacylglycerol--glycerol-3-phosphate 3-phosphatidyltransferase n=1 Tax=Candidatus Falkowbacteria bacterium RIFOXYC2_FULL_48_21 TaxID=1798005 RepID=A0A1F5T833_9BACT|nr:MAG: hypothetical protein A2482_00990 [Candidatus Falkowbacteria bacterium RIFOXYC2_FULL_48_21]